MDAQQKKMLCVVYLKIHQNIRNNMAMKNNTAAMPQKQTNKKIPKKVQKSWQKKERMGDACQKTPNILDAQNTMAAMQNTA